MLRIIGALLRQLPTYISDGRRWPGGSCELNVAPHLLPGAWRGVVQSAMDDWNNAGASFRFVADPASPNLVTRYDQGRWNGRLANTLVYPTRRGTPLSHVLIEINTYWNWDPPHPAPMGGRDPSPRIVSLENAVKHELGHALYLGHSADPMAIMYATLTPSASPTPLGTDDVAGIRALYP